MTAPMRIMMIDDEKLDLMLYRRLFRKWEGEVDEVDFSYADDALNYLKDDANTAVDAILLDINLPRMNGFELLSEMDFVFNNKTWPEVFVLSTSMDPRDRLRVLAHERVHGFIEKPLTENKLQGIIDILASRQTGSAGLDGAAGI